MENEIYETSGLSDFQIKNFTDFLDNKIGTEYELNAVDIYDEHSKYIGEKTSITVFSLNREEVEAIRDFEQNHLDEPYEKYCALWKLKDDDTVYRSKFFDTMDEADDYHEKNVNKIGSELFDFKFVESNLDEYYVNLLKKAIEVENKNETIEKIIKMPESCLVESNTFSEKEKAIIQKKELIEEYKALTDKIKSTESELEYYPNDRQLEEELSNLIDKSYDVRDKLDEMNNRSSFTQDKLDANKTVIKLDDKKWDELVKDSAKRLSNDNLKLK